MAFGLFFFNCAYSMALVFVQGLSSKKVAPTAEFASKVGHVFHAKCNENKRCVCAEIVTAFWRECFGRVPGLLVLLALII